MGERWFTEEELGEMSRPTMDRAIEAIDSGDAEEAKRLCESMKHESQFMHDLLVDGTAGLISFIKEKLRGRRGGRGLGVEPGAELEAGGDEDLGVRPQGDRAGSGGDVAGPLDQRGRPQAGGLRGG